MLTLKLVKTLTAGIWSSRIIGRDQLSALLRRIDELNFPISTKFNVTWGVYVVPQSLTITATGFSLATTMYV